MAQQAVHRRSVEQSSGVAERADESDVIFRQGKDQVERDPGLRERDRFQSEPPHPRPDPFQTQGESRQLPLLGIGLLENECRLNQRRAARISHRRELLAEQSERVLLILQSSTYFKLRLSQMIAIGGI